MASTAAVYPINDFPNSEDKTTAAPIDIYGYLIAKDDNTASDRRILISQSTNFQAI